MPSKSRAQAKLMRIAAHTPGGYGGVPQSVGSEFEAADEARPRKLPARKAKGITVAQAAAKYSKMRPRV